jgi:hypothetical protein
MYICTKCGATTEFPEIRITARATRYLPEEKEQSRCECGGHFVEAKKCIVCGDYYPREKISNNNYICEYCLEDEAESNGYEYGLAIGEDNKTDVYINGLVATLLTPEQINKILVDYVEKNKENIKDFAYKCEKYCREDLYCFSQYVEEKTKNDK